MQPQFFFCPIQFSSSSAPFQRRQRHPTPVLLPGESHGRRSLVGCSPRGRQESDTTERLHFHFSLSCIGERNGNPLQCSYLENPRNGGTWSAAVFGVSQSWTRLERLSSSSSSRPVQLSYSQSLSCVRLFVTPWTAAHQASLSITNSWLKFMSIKSVMPFNHLFSVVLLSSHLQSFPVSGSLPNESILCIKWPKYWSFDFIISPSNGRTFL